MTASGWRRDATPRRLCKCSHSIAEHNIDTKAMPCSHHPCGCLRFREKAQEWREHRTVLEVLDHSDCRVVTVECCDTSADLDCDSDLWVASPDGGATYLHIDGHCEGDR